MRRGESLGGLGGEVVVVVAVVGGFLGWSMGGWLFGLKMLLRDRMFCFEKGLVLWLAVGMMCLLMLKVVRLVLLVLDGWIRN